MLDLRGKTALVTGASGGIGSAVAALLAECGADLALGYGRNRARAEEIAAPARAGGRRVELYAVDVADFEATRRWVDEVVAAFGAIDIVVNAVGWQGHRAFQLFIDQEPDDWQAILDIELLSPIYVARAAVHHMIERRSGRIITIGSDASKAGESGAAVSAAARGGNNAFSKSLAREVARHGITVNTVCPGPTDTPLFHRIATSGETGAKIVAALTRAVPMKRIGTAREVAAAVAFLASDEASYVTGQAISVSGGLTMC